MKPSIVGAVLLLLCSNSSSFAQRDPPVWESYLASTTITHGAPSKSDLEFLFKKECGPHEHTEHQMYLIAYLKKDEKKVLAYVTDKSLLDKRKSNTKLFLDVLLEKRLVTVVATDVGKRTSFAAQDSVGKYRDGSDADRGKASLKVNTFPFRYSIENKQLFESVSKLPSFDAKNVVVVRNRVFFKDTIRFLVFVPVNDCKYATKVSKEVRGKYDFAKCNTDIDSNSELFYLKTAILYCKPIPQEFTIKRIGDERFMIYIN